MNILGVELVKLRKATQELVNAYDPFEINYAERPYDLMTDADLQREAGGVLFLDVECFSNYFLLSFRSLQSKKIIYFEIIDGEESNWNTSKIWWILNNFWTVGFNSNTYDILLLCFVLAYNCDTQTIKAKSNEIILNRMYPAEFYKENKIHRPQLKHIDLIEVAPLMASLKIYGGRLHAPRMQELPIEHDSVLDEKQINAVRYYNINDLELTEILFVELKPQLDLRWQMSKEYSTDLLSKSDAQIAEAVISSELRKKLGFFPKKPDIKPGTVYKYQVPSYLQYELPQLKQMLEIVRNADFVVNGAGVIDMPEALNEMKIKIGSSLYRMGIGGLHSSEKCVAHKSDENTLLIDKDVASYYPSIILNLQLYPKHLGKSFLSVYREIVNRRLEAKRIAPKGVIEQSLKITINGSFGKLGNRYSVLYSPDLLIQVTMTGQLCLLMLIELIESVGIPVVSANTDGVLSKCPKDRYNYMESAVIHWQNLTGFETEETRYKAVYSRDVNNYIAIKEDNKSKVKGVYTEKGSSQNSVLSKNPETMICNDALIKFLCDGVPIEKTILDCKDIRRFVSVRNVKGGGEKSGVYLGKAVRWYYSTQAQGEINYVSTGNKVPKSDGAMPLMDLPTKLPVDIDYQWYINTAKEMLTEIGYHGKQEATLFDY